MNNYDLSLFFNGTYEKNINYKLFYYAYQFSELEVMEYVHRFLDIPYVNYLNYIFSLNVVPTVTSKDVYQFSSLEDSTYGICSKFSSHNDSGFKYKEVGKLLLSDGKLRNDGAYTKYGENQAKTAEAMGLVQIKDYYCYLTCLGKIYLTLSASEQKKLLSRVVLRNILIQNLLFNAQTAKVSVSNSISFLSRSTIKRRLSNIKSVLKLVENNGEIDLSILFENIDVHF